MIVAEICVMQAGAGSRPITHNVKFADLAKAMAEFNRVSTLMEERGAPKLVEIDGGCGGKVALPLNELRSIGLVDFTQANAQLAGFRDAFPNLFKV